MRRRLGPAVVFLVAAAAVSMFSIVEAQGPAVGQNINVITGSSNQYIGDLFRQRQDEPVVGISSVNPSHIVVAYNDYRTVDFADDPIVGAASPGQGAVAKLFDFLRAPWKRGDERKREEHAEADAAQAWIGLSFSDNNGKNWYTGLHPGHHAVPPVTGAEAWDQSMQLATYDAASDPVMATTSNQFFVGGIAFTPNGSSVGFVSRLTDRNDSRNGQNVHFDGTRILLTQPAGFFVDKPSISAGPNGHVYAAFVVFDETDPKKLSSKILFFTSSDYGVTWSAGLVISQPLTRNQSPWILVDPNNENVVYVGWRVFANPLFPTLTNAVVGRKSTNGGVSFVPSVPYPVALLLKPFDQPQGALSQSLPIPRSNAYPTAAIDGNGAIHVAIQEYVNPSTGVPLAPSQSPTMGVPRITVTSSYDSGATWTLRKAIDVGPGSGAQFMPVIAAVGEPGSSCLGFAGPRSRILLMYYDARAGGVGRTAGSSGYVAGGGTQFDVRIAQASACDRDSAGRPIFTASEQVSRYTLSATPPYGIVTRAGSINGQGVASVNRAYSMFCGGTCAFTGDYIHLTPRIPYVFTAAGWKPTTANAVDKTKLPIPVVQGVWADGRDALLPTIGPLRPVPAGGSAIDMLPWNIYQPPGTGQVSCINPGSRDQNVYTMEYAPGQLFAAAPETFQSSNIPHAYPLYVENRAGEQRFFRLTIDPASFSSFDYRTFNTPNAAPFSRTADTVIGPYSTVTGSVVIGPSVTTPVTISIAQLASTNDGHGNVISSGTILTNGAQTSVTLFPGTANTATTTETHAPVVAPRPVVSKPLAGTQFPVQMTPFTQTPFTQTTYEANPFTQTPFTRTTTVFDVTDYSFTVTGAGDSAAAYSALLSIQNAVNLTGSFLFQVFINRVGSAPALNGCQAIDRPVDIQISNIKAPFTQTPFTQTPFTQTPFTQTPFTQTPFTQTPFTQTPFTQTSDPRDPSITNSTFYIAPQGSSSPDYRAVRPVDEVRYVLRAFQLKANDDTTLVPLEADPAHPTGQFVAVTVAAETPNVIVVNGTPVFDPTGPPASSGGAAIPVKLAFATQPASTNINTAIAPPVRVAIQDGFGTTVTTSTLPVTIAIGTNPSSGTLSGMLTVNAVAGVATFSNLSINKAGVGYTLVASSPNVASATSNTFDVVIPVVFDSGTILSSQLTNPANSVIYRPAFGDVLVSDFGANRVARIVAVGLSAGSTSTFAAVTSPDEMAISPAGDVFVKTHAGGPISRFDSSGTLLGSFAVPALDPTGLAFDTAGNLYSADCNGTVYRFAAGTFASPSIFASGVGCIEGIAFSPTGQLFAALWSTGEIYQITPGGTSPAQHVLWASGLTGPLNFAFDPIRGQVYASNTSTIVRIPSPGHIITVATGFSGGIGAGTYDLDFDASGNLYVDDFTTSRLWKFTRIQ